MSSVDPVLVSPYCRFLSFANAVTCLNRPCHLVSIDGWASEDFGVVPRTSTVMLGLAFPFDAAIDTYFSSVIADRYRRFCIDTR